MAKKNKTTTEQVTPEQIAEQVVIDRPGVINTQPEVTPEQTQEDIGAARIDAAKNGLSVPIDKLSDSALKAKATTMTAPLVTTEALAVRNKSAEGNSAQAEKEVQVDNKEEDVNSLDARIAAAKAGVQQKRDAATQNRLNADAKAREALLSAHKSESDAVRTYNEAMWGNLGEIAKEIETKQTEAKEKDKVAQRREKAMRYISGLGDTLSSIANLIGTVHGASNQKQVYNSHAVVQKAEEARKARKLEIDDLSKRLDEMLARQKELKAAGNLKEAEVAARQAKELAAQEAAARKAAIEEGKYYDALEKAAVAEATSAYNREQDVAHRDKVFNENVRQFNENQKRLSKQVRGGGRRTDTAYQGQKTKAAMEKYVTDPKNQQKVVTANIRTIRNAFAKEMGFEDYNDYLRYKDITFLNFSRDIPGMGDREARKHFKDLTNANPDAYQWLQDLENYEYLSETQLAQLAEASPTYVNALGVAAQRMAGVQPKGDDKKVETGKNPKEDPNL